MGKVRMDASSSVWRRSLLWFGHHWLSLGGLCGFDYVKEHCLHILLIIVLHVVGPCCIGVHLHLNLLLSLLISIDLMVHSEKSHNREHIRAYEVKALPHFEPARVAFNKRGNFRQIKSNNQGKSTTQKVWASKETQDNFKPLFFNLERAGAFNVHHIVLWDEVIHDAD